MRPERFQVSDSPPAGSEDLSGAAAVPPTPPSPRLYSRENGRWTFWPSVIPQAEVSERSVRSTEKTLRGGPPSPATLDREVELLKRVLNHAVRLGTLRHNPIAEARLLRKPNARRMVVDEEMFGRLFEASEEPLRPILLLAFDTGMRKREVLDLRWEQVDLRSGTITLAHPGHEVRGAEAGDAHRTARYGPQGASPRHRRRSGLPQSEDGTTLGGPPPLVPSGAAQGQAPRTLVPRPPPELRHPRAEGGHPRVGGDAHVGTPHPRGLRPLQRRRRERPANRRPDARRPTPLRRRPPGAGC